MIDGGSTCPVGMFSCVIYSSYVVMLGNGVAEV